MADRIVETFRREDLQNTHLPMICLYERPDDYPDFFVARLWDGRHPTNLVATGRTLEEIRRVMPLGMLTIPRLPQDDKNIVEVWI